MKYLSFILLLLLSACSTFQQAVYTGVSAVTGHDGASLKCEQGHAQDRVDCRKRKQEQVDALNKSIKKQTEQ
ncbi:hypothetical protein [Colwellia sp. Bg11-12]|jgi:hypothetical protein|uniref:hypothetical protein n=1 Tax=Colwellia sp. Bg11-12 TaxID=2759817 RepID=UPI0015F436EE|nr:hypothetical protein [Colwellia sp. Bg11-12]MBA6263849.1 hypothetical protein [Colwellia sp. Bg11-12]